jgi:hypothetical protein
MRLQEVDHLCPKATTGTYNPLNYIRGNKFLDENVLQNMANNPQDMRLMESKITYLQQALQTNTLPELIPYPQITRNEGQFQFNQQHTIYQDQLNNLNNNQLDLQNTIIANEPQIISTNQYSEPQIYSNNIVQEDDFCSSDEDEEAEERMLQENINKIKLRDDVLSYHKSGHLEPINRPLGDKMFQEPMISETPIISVSNQTGFNSQLRQDEPYIPNQIQRSKTFEHIQGEDIGYKNIDKNIIRHSTLITPNENVNIENITTQPRIIQPLDPNQMKAKINLKDLENYKIYQ